MSQSITGLSWKSTSAAGQPVAPFTLNGGIDTVWNFANLYGDFAGTAMLHARGFTVDNSQNKTTMTCLVSNVLTLNVNAFEKQNFTLPANSNSVQFTIAGTAAGVQVTFWVDPTPFGAGGPNFAAISNQQAITAAALNSSAMNPIINSQFTVWPEGTAIGVGAAGAATYGPEGWQISRNGGAANAFVSQSSNVISGAAFVANIQRNAGTSDTGTIFFSTQLRTIDSCIFQGQTITLAFDAQSAGNFSSAGSILTCAVFAGVGTDQNLNSGLTGQTQLVAKNFTLTNTAQRFSMQINVPSNTTQLAFSLSYVPVGTAGAADAYQVTRFQFDIGSSPQSYRPVPEELERDRCLGFFQQFGGAPVVITLGTVWFVSTALAVGILQFQRKRSTPTITVVSVGDFCVFTRGGAAVETLSSMVASGITPDFIEFNLNFPNDATLVANWAGNWLLGNISLGDSAASAARAMLKISARM